jgi:D-alanyl-D-alanine carboxypeptidase (penicillin-binding protein 5/6)
MLLILLRPAFCYAGPELNATAAILINGRTGEVLWGKEIDRRMHPASTTKIMTAILLLENASLDEIATVSSQAACTSGSSLYLTEGQSISITDLLFAIMIHSANDAAVVAAEHVAGSIPAFAAMMNQKALQAGARYSQFVNPHGLTESGHLTTAYDLAMIARYAMKNPLFRQIVATESYPISWSEGEGRLLLNKNSLLGRYEGILGIKSGYTVEAQRTFVAAAERNGMELIAVVLQSKGSGVWEDAEVLLDYGFDHFAVVEAVKKGEVLATSPVRYGGDAFLEAAEDFSFTRLKGPVDVKLDVRVNEKLKAPILQGQSLGEVLVLCDGIPVGSTDLVAVQAVPRVYLAMSRFWLFYAFCGLASLRIRKLYRRRRRRKRSFYRHNRMM